MSWPIKRLHTAAQFLLLSGYSFGLFRTDFSTAEAESYVSSVLSHDLSLLYVLPSTQDEPPDNFLNQY